VVKFQKVVQQEAIPAATPSAPSESPHPSHPIRVIPIRVQRVMHAARVGRAAGEAGAARLRAAPHDSINAHRVVVPAVAGHGRGAVARAYPAAAHAFSNI
jgi:hypothetical protein